MDLTSEYGVSRRDKFGRVKHASPWGAYHRTFRALWEAIPASAKKTLTATQLAELIEAMHRPSRQL